MKTVVKILLGVAIVFLVYLCVMSIVTPIQFENTRTVRERAIVSHLIDIRAAQLEYKDQHNRFVSDLDSLVDFVKTGKKKKKSNPVTPEPEVVEDGYDGYYNDVIPSDEGRRREGVDKELVKKISILLACLLVIIAACVVLMYIL